MRFIRNDHYGHIPTWNALVFIAITAFSGMSRTITATPANTEGPKALKERKIHPLLFWSLEFKTW